MTFWIIVAALCVVALGFSAWPLYRGKGRLTPLVTTVVLGTALLSFGLYDRLGSPGVPSGRGGQDTHGMEQAVQSLQARLANQPDDVAGWKMLGRSHMSMQNFGAAVQAFEKAAQLEGNANAQTLVDLALALLNRDGSAIEGRPASLIEGALAIEPNNPAALFYAGIAAAEKGDTSTAADRWELLLGLNPPDEIRPLLEQRIAEWRGQPMPAATSQAPATSPAPEPAQPAELPEDAVVMARVALSADARAAINSDAFVFIIARDPQQPAPPIAVVRKRVSELPADVALGDAQSMVAGRALSGFERFEILARVSLSGSPGAQSGDWFGSQIVTPAAANSVNLTIDQQVP